jgi:phospholipase C
VPAVVISPYVQAGSIVRPPEGAPPFDHTSLIATLHALFNLGAPLSPRVAAAPDLISALQLERPENMGPPLIDITVSRPTREEMRAMRRRPRNNYQRRLRWPGSLLAAFGASAAAHAHRARRRMRRK